MKQQEEARLESRCGKPLLLERVSLVGDVRGMLFEACVMQHFYNPAAEHVEVVYTFPLPWNAVLLNVAVQLSERHLVGTVVPRATAEEGYEAALGEGDAAILLQQNHDHTYSLNLGNLAAGERCIVTLRYAQVLQFTQRSLRLLVPTAIAPRYGDPVVDGGLQPHQVPVFDLGAAYPFDVTITLHGQLAYARVASPSHAVAVARPAGQEGLSVVISLQHTGALDRDFVVVVAELADRDVGFAAADSVVSGAVAVLAGFCPNVQAWDAAAHDSIRLKILVDCSGSMNGDSIEAARRSLHAVVEQLAGNDRFSLSRFGSTAVHRSRGLWPMTEVTRLAARRWIDSLEADLGGTEMADALTSTFALPSDRASDVLLVTDGEISAIDHTIAAATASGNRVFVVAIGSSPAESHLRRLAQATGGACDFVASGEAVAPAVLRMFARLRSPRLHDLCLQWPEGITPVWTSPLPSAVFHGDTVDIFALVSGSGAGMVQLAGALTPGGVTEMLGRVSLAADPAAGETLARMVASARAETVPGLAVDYQLVTRETSFLLAHVRAEGDKATSMPQLHRIAQMVPAGWSGLGTVRYAKGTESSAGVSWNINQAYSAALRPPAVFRRIGPARVTDTGPIYDIPAFLRKQTPGPVDRYDSRCWSQSSAEVGFTPLGTSQWLRGTAQSLWPTTPDELRDAGVPAWVVEWLELVVGSGPSGAKSAIRLFLLVMAQQPVHDALEQGGLMQAVMPTILQRVLADPKASNASRTQAESLVVALAGMQANRWPDAVYSMA